MEFEPALAFIRKEIDKILEGRESVREGFLHDFVMSKSSISGLLGSALSERLVRHLETFYWTINPDGHALTFEHKTWYPNRKSKAGHEAYYWKRLSEYWTIDTALPRDAIRSVDKVTDEIMDYLGDPESKDSTWFRRGLVMGHVQSGKTTNYSALITKAADAGYTVIIVLAGMTNALRRQTQERLDKAFVGKSSVGDGQHARIYPVATVFGLGDGIARRYPFCGTTQLNDFGINIVRGITATEGNFREPILFVTKKHAGILNKLAEWLKNIGHAEKIDGPMLLIDDEADNATVNTREPDSAIGPVNAAIRNLLSVSKRKSYVGYTATPFANIFIHPESEDEMLGDDLFPRDFIKSLDPPSNYIGANDLFLEAGRLHETCVRVIPDDYQDVLPIKHKSNFQVGFLPESLHDAVYEYILSCAIRELSGDKGHSSMLVNVSRFNAVQRQVHDMISDELSFIVSAYRVWSKMDQWARSPVLERSHSIWLNEFSQECQFSWDEIRDRLYESAARIEIKMVNMQGAALEYPEDFPVHVIAVGGLSLARGLTLEGLAVSYVLRNVGAGDTLLQIGRWFGYRSGYESLCRIHLPQQMVYHFEDITNSVEELRQDLVRMEKLRRTPKEFGLKVRESEAGIAITAANKMRSAKSVLLAADYNAKHVQAYEIYDDKRIQSNNINKARKFVARIGKQQAVEFKREAGAFVWSNVDPDDVVRFLREVDLPGNNFVKMADGKTLISDYIAEMRRCEKGTLWTVAMPFTGYRTKSSVARNTLPFDAHFSCDSAYTRQRFTASRTDNGFLRITAKNVVADLPETDLSHGEAKSFLRDQVKLLQEEDTTLSLEAAYLNARTSPLLNLHVFQLSLGNDQLHFDESLAFSVSVGLVKSDFRPSEKRYAATVQLQRLLEESYSLAQDEEADNQ